MTQEIPLPGDRALRDLQRAEESSTDAADMDGNELSAAGETCARCGTEIRSGQPTIRLVDGRWEHEAC